MGSYIQHILFGIVVTFSFILFVFYMQERYGYEFLHYDIQSIKVFVYSFPLIVYFSLLPDIDIRTSIIRKFNDILLISFSIGFFIIYMIEKDGIYAFWGFGMLFCYLLLFLLKHRGIAHSIVAGIVLSLPIAFFSLDFYFLALVAYCSHLMLDMSFKFV